MAQDGLILDRYEPLGTAGEGGFGTVQIAWDPRIQRKVAIKTIRLTELDAARAALPGAQAVAAPAESAASEAAGPQEGGADATAGEPADIPPWEEPSQWPEGWEDLDFDPTLPESSPLLAPASAEPSRSDQVTSLAHIPGLDEARTAAMLADPRIVTVYDFEVRDRTAYLIMEYVEGITLTDLLVDYSDYLTLDIVAAVFDSVAGALAMAHESGVLHLDIKPDNILINAQGQVKVTDFGLATLADASGTGKTGGGTIGYMPPEQINRQPLDARSDEWSLASVTYEMLTGSNPFRVGALADAEAAIVDAELVVPSLCWNDIDDQVDDVVFYALDPNPDERYASVADFAEEMLKFLGDPESGTEQLKMVVERALEPPEPVQIVPVDAQSALGASPMRAPQKTFTERFLDLLGPSPSEDADAQAELANEEDAQAETESELTPTEEIDSKPAQRPDPLVAKLPKPLVVVLGHLFGAVGSGFVGALALTNMDPIVTMLGEGSGYAVAVAIAAVAALGLIRSHIGALVAFCLLGIALVMCGHPIAAAVLLIATVTWWYTVGHKGIASANVALLLPLAGAIGGSSAVPFFSGVSLKPVQALVTTAFCLVVAFVLAGFGTHSLLGWNAIAFGDFGRADVSASIVGMLTQKATWATVAGWLVATLGLSLLRLRKSKVLTVLGVVVALAAVLFGSLVFASPTPELLVTSILTALALIVATV